MFIDAHWQQRGLEALRATLDADPATKKRMIEFLLDEGFWNKESLSWDAAVSRFNDCLNAGKPAFFKIAEVWALMLRFERYELFFAMARDLGFEVRRTPTEERRQLLLERIAAATEACANAIASNQAELARLTTEPAVLQGHGGHTRRFSLRDPYEAPAGGF